MKAIMTIIYGCVVIGIGLWRHLQTGSSPKALWFGLVMGVIAISGGILLMLKKHIPAYIATFIAFGFVGGYFGYRILTHPSDGVTSIRVWIVFAATIVAAILLVIPSSKNNAGQSAAS